jgi:hypothetical protein
MRLFICALTLIVLASCQFIPAQRDADGNIKVPASVQVSEDLPPGLPPWVYLVWPLVAGPLTYLGTRYMRKRLEPNDGPRN